MRPVASYTLRQTAEDWLADGLPGRAAKTVEVNAGAPNLLLAWIGNIPLRELTSRDVRAALVQAASTHATRTVQKTHNCLTASSGTPRRKT